MRLDCYSPLSKALPRLKPTPNMPATTLRFMAVTTQTLPTLSTTTKSDRKKNGRRKATLRELVQKVLLATTALLARLTASRVTSRAPRSLLIATPTRLNLAVR